MKKPVAERFWSKVIKSDGCWLYTGAPDSKGYGQFYLKGRAKGSTGAHRAAWELTNGPIPDGLDVLHHCDNPPCVRPDHLFLGTQEDNIRDAQLKGRIPMGRKARPRSLRPRYKLDETAVRTIRQLHERGVQSCSELARSFGVDLSSVCRIVKRKAWRQVA